MKKIPILTLITLLLSACALQAQSEISHYTYDGSGNQITRSRPAIIHGVNVASDVSIDAGATATLWATGGAAYAWNTGDTSAQIAVAPALTSTYTVTVTCACGTTQVNNLTVTVLPSTATQEVAPTVAFSLAPNPAAEQLSIQITLPEAAETVLHCCDAQGKEIWQRSISGSEIVVQENCQNLSKGTYRVFFAYKGRQYARSLVIL